MKTTTNLINKWKNNTRKTQHTNKLSDCITETIEDMEKNELIGPIVSHAGDGNFHVALLIDKNNKTELEKLGRKHGIELDRRFRKSDLVETLFKHLKDK